jgi:hypothetical protein
VILPPPLLTDPERSNATETSSKVGERINGELVLENTDNEVEVEDDLAGYPSP